MTATTARSAPAGQVARTPRLTGRRRTSIGHGILHAALIVWGITFLVPLLWMLSTSLKTSGQVFILPVQWIPKNPQWSNYQEIFKILPLASFLRNSLFVTAMGMLGTVFSSLLVGYSLARLRWPGREAVFSMLVASMMLPGIVTLIPTFILYKYLGWVDTFLPLFVPSWFGTPFYIFMMRQFMIGLPYELEEAARIDGASSMRILTTIIVPLCGPAIAAVAIFSSLAHYNDFLGPLIYLSTNDKFTIPLGLQWYAGRYGNFWHLVMAASTVALAPVMVLFFVAQRYFVRGIVLSGLAGR
jgi:multiple sugar transport system permease protein